MPVRAGKHGGEASRGIAIFGGCGGLGLVASESAYLQILGQLCHFALFLALLSFQFGDLGFESALALPDSFVFLSLLLKLLSSQPHRAVRLAGTWAVVADKVATYQLESLPSMISMISHIQQAFEVTVASALDSDWKNVPQQE